MASVGSTANTTRVPFSDYEKVYVHMSRAFKPLDKEHWQIHCLCSIEYRPLDTSVLLRDELRSAWQCLATEYPGLTAHPVGPERQISSLDATVLELFADQTFFVTENTTPEEIIERSQPLDSPILHFFPKSSEILLLTQHWRVDGLGCCMLVNRLFELVTTKTTVSDTLAKNLSINLPVCLEEAAGSSLSSDEIVQSYARERIDDFHKNAVSAGGLPYEGDAARLPARARYRTVSFTAAESGTIIQECKERCISVSAAIHVALARSYFELNSEKSVDKQPTTFTNVLAVNMRPYLQSPYNTRAHACQTYVASITPSIPRDRSFVDACTALTQEYRSWFTPQFQKALAWMYRYNAERLFQNQTAAATRGDKEGEEASQEQEPQLPAPVRPPSGITLSSLGVIENHIHPDFEDNTLVVEKFRFGVSMMTRQMLLYAWTFRGKLTLSLDYNEAYYSSAMADRVLARVQFNLLAGLSQRAEVDKKQGKWKE